MTAADLDALDGLIAKAGPPGRGCPTCGCRVWAEHGPCHGSAALAALPSLLSRLRSAEQDAARYRAMRDPAFKWIELFGHLKHDGKNVWVRVLSRRASGELDTIIDAARREPT